MMDAPSNLGGSRRGDSIALPTDLLADVVRALLDPDEKEREACARFLMYGMMRYSNVPEDTALVLVEDSLIIIQAIHRGEDVSEEDRREVSNRLAEWGEPK